MKTYAQARYEFSRRYLKRLMKEAEFQVTKAAVIAGRNRTDFYKLIHRYRLENLLTKPRKTGKWDNPMPPDW